ncbi:hypothetical protein RJ641_033235 [Dillenia turbinata]|uniref:Uncharacterized protein n=1 Tax=Dillenia turbinata TaxID=194707 RepID=A0AAN8VL61_9MAGN
MGYCIIVLLPSVIKKKETWRLTMGNLVAVIASCSPPPLRKKRNTHTRDDLYLYYKKVRFADDADTDERLNEYKKHIDRAIKDFIKMFDDVTGNEFEPWEREKKFQKKPSKFYPVDMVLYLASQAVTNKGIDARHGALGLRQQGIAVTHCKLIHKLLTL